MQAQPHSAVVIAGGGLVGASLALALARQGLPVTLVEAQPPPQGQPAWDERCIALNATSQAIFARLGVWERLQAQAEPILSTHISERGRFGVARFTHDEAGLPALGYNLPLRAIGEAVWALLAGTPARVICPARVTAVEGDGSHRRVGLDSGATLPAALLVAADGAQSSVRGLLGLGAITDDYAQQAIVTAVRTHRSPAGCAYERFTPEGPIALLPKPGGACSLIWTVPAARAPELLALDAAGFLVAAQDAFGGRLGAFTTLGRRSAYPLSRVMSSQLSAPRTLFCGNAAQSLHPVAAQGFNLGLRDVATLADLLSGAADPGTPEVLAAYCERRERDRARTADFTDGLVRLFSNRIPGLASLRHLGLLALDLTPPLKRAVLWQNLGRSGWQAA